MKIINMNKRMKEWKNRDSNEIVKDKGLGEKESEEKRKKREA